MSAAATQSNQRPPVNLKNYVFSERLGSGSYGDVYKAHGKTGAREAVAVKCVLKSKLCKAEIDNIVTEISMMKKLKHPYIVEMRDFSWDANYIYIIMDYCGGGDLSKFIKARRVLDEQVCRTFLRQLASALQYLRSKNVAHMDLKPSNILLSSPRKPVLKLADFGFAQYFSEEETQSKIKGSPLYMAPEMLLERKYDAKVDLWSVGIILYEALFGKAPYKSDSIDEVLVKIKERRPIVIPRNRSISEGCRDLLTRCLEQNPEERISFEDFFGHSFLDLEHMPSDESHAKAMSLVEEAKRKESEGLLEEALGFYTKALEYLVPLAQSEQSSVRKEALRKMTMVYLTKAGEIKKILHPEQSTSTSANKPSSSASASSRKSDLDRCDSESERLAELKRLSHMNPKLATGIEIAETAEAYELEAQYGVALEKYQSALGVLIPALQDEPAGRRKTLLHAEVSKWMRRAERVKEALNIQEKVLADSVAMGESVEGKACKIQ